MKRVEVTHVTPAGFGSGGLWGGGERYPVGLAMAMSRRVPTRLIVFGSRYNRRQEGSLEICEVPIRRRWRGGSVNPLSEGLLAFAPFTRRWHVHQYHSVVTNALLLTGAALRQDVFVTDHGGRSYNYADRLRLERLVSALVPVSNFSAGFFPQLADRTAPPILGGSPPVFQPGDEPRRRQVVFIGRLMPHKGVDVLIRAVGAQTPLHIYGRPYEPAYRRLLGELAEGKDVTFHEGAPDEEIARALRTSKVAVLPSVYRSYDGNEHAWSELLGLTLIEALASGTPVVATRVGGMPEVVRDGETGYLVEPGDPEALGDRIAAVLDAEDWPQLSRAALAHAATELNWDVAAGRSLDAYERFGRRGAARPG